MRKVLTTALLASGTVCTVAAGAARVISGPYRPKLFYGFTPYELQIPCEDLGLPSANNTRIAGWWLDRPESSRVVIVAHGHRGSRQDVLGISAGLWRAGDTVLLFDFRGSGDSSDGPQSLAYYEQADLHAAIDYAIQRRPDAHVCLVGFSMGTAASLLVAAQRPEVHAIVAGSPFASVSGVIAASIRRYWLPSWPLLALTDKATSLMYGYRFDAVRPIDVIDQISPRPLLLLHSDQDSIIPIQQVYELFDKALEPKRLVIFPGADHCGGYFQDRPGYVAMVKEFFDQTLAMPETSG